MIVLPMFGVFCTRTTAPVLAAAAGVATASLTSRKTWPLPRCSELESKVSDRGTKTSGVIKTAPLPRWLQALLAGGADVSDPPKKIKISDYEAAQRTRLASIANAKFSAAPPSGDPSRLRLVSFNVHAMRDCHNDDNLEQVVDVLEILDADIVAMQEAALPPCLGPDGRPNSTSDPMILQGAKEGVAFDAFIEENMKIQFDKLSQNHDLQWKDGVDLLQGMRDLGYTDAVYAPGSIHRRSSKQVMYPCGNVVFSKRPLVGGSGFKIIDPLRHGVHRSAAIAAVIASGRNVDAYSTEDVITVVSTHLDAHVERKGSFGLAEGELVRLLEVEALHHALSEHPSLVILGDFNATSRRAECSSPTHRQLSDALDSVKHSRSPAMYRHFLPRDCGAAQQRLRDEWCMTSLGFAEGRLGYRHGWELQDANQGLPPLYSHWSGQLIDHCIVRDTGSTGQPARFRVSHVGVFHTDASDHLPLVVDIEFMS